MALYNQKTVVVIDDNIYDLMEFYKTVLCKKEFGFSADKIKFIRLSDLSATIPADRIDDFRMYFYIFEKINTAEEYAEAAEKLICSPNTDVTLLHCQDGKAFDVCSCRTADFCNVHCISINRDFVVKDSVSFELSPKEHKSRNCLYLSTVLYYLLSLEEGAYSDYSFEIKINYPSVYCAAQYPIIEIGEKVLELENKIKNEKKLIETLEAEKPRRYKLDFSMPEVSESVSNVSFEDVESEQALKELASMCADCESAIGKTITRDINAVRYAMAEMDEFAKGGEEPEFHKTTGDSYERIPTSDDLLRNVELIDGSNINISQAINLAKSLVKTDKPKFKPFLIGAGIGTLFFLVCVALIYVVNIIKNGTASVDKGLLVVCLCVPVVSFLLAGIIGFIVNIVEFRKIKDLLASIRNAIRNRANSFNSLVERVRAYLNDFLTVFCNHHAKDFRVLQANKRIYAMEKEKDLMIGTLDTNNSFADDIKNLFDYEQALIEAENIDEDDSLDEYYKVDTGDIDYDTDKGIVFDEDMDSKDVEEDQQVKIVLEKCSTCKQCIAFVKEKCKTDIDGDESTIFVDTKSPWLTYIDVSDNVNGGVL